MRTRDAADKLQAEQKKYDSILSLGPIKEKVCFSNLNYMYSKNPRMES